MTSSDLAIWIYGNDDQDDCHAARQTIHRLRRAGYVIESRPATWEIVTNGCPLGYRLVSVPAHGRAA